MPEMRFDIIWPDGRMESCYSPSLVIKDFFTPGESYDVAKFLTLSRTALNEASARVARKFGMPCSRALAQLAVLEAGCARFAENPAAQIRVKTFHE